MSATHAALVVLWWLLKVTGVDVVNVPMFHAIWMAQCPVCGRSLRATKQRLVHVVLVAAGSINSELQFLFLFSNYLIGGCDVPSCLVSFKCWLTFYVCWLSRTELDVNWCFDWYLLVNVCTCCRGVRVMLARSRFWMRSRDRSRSVFVLVGITCTKSPTDSTA